MTFAQDVKDGFVGFGQGLGDLAGGLVFNTGETLQSGLKTAQNIVSDTVEIGKYAANDPKNFTKDLGVSVGESAKSIIVQEGENGEYKPGKLGNIIGSSAASLPIAVATSGSQVSAKSVKAASTKTLTPQDIIRNFENAKRAGITQTAEEIQAYQQAIVQLNSAYLTPDELAATNNGLKQPVKNLNEVTASLLPDNPLRPGERFHDPISGSELIVLNDPGHNLYQEVVLGNVKGGFTKLAGAGKSSDNIIGWRAGTDFIDVEKALINHKNGVRQFILDEKGGSQASEIANVIKEPNGSITIIGPNGQTLTSRKPHNLGEARIFGLGNNPDSQAVSKHLYKAVNGYPVMANTNQNLPWGEKLSAVKLPNGKQVVKFEPVDSTPAIITRAGTSQKIEIGLNDSNKANFGILQEGDKLSLRDKTYTVTKGNNGDFLLKE